MKNICINKYMVAVSAVIASLVSCTRIEEQEIPDVTPKVHMTFTADIEGRADTKTVLGGQMGDTYRKVLWEPQDSIGITSSLSNASFDKFVNIETSLSGVGTFDGSTSEGSTYYLFYPYSSTLSAKDGDKITFKLPSTQVYRDNSFSSDAMPMVSKGPRGERYRFYSLCGVFALNLTGSETVRSVSFTGKDASGNYLPVSGEFSVNMNYEEFPEIVAGETVSASVSLNCGEGVTLDPSKPTPFYMVLPVAKYESFTIMVSTADGKVMMKEVNKTLDIKRATVTKTASLAYVASETINLSASGWANCYVVSEPGQYSFDATVIGNGDFGMIQDAGFHTTSTSIAPASADIVWEDTPGVISAPSFDGKRISFMASGIEGNALVAAKDADGTILWSWHIWVTDKPVDQTYVNWAGTFVMMDRDIGATRADRGSGNEWTEGKGVLYQWGRKDPIVKGKYTLNHTAWGQFSIAESIQKPTILPYANSNWNSWMTEENYNVWSSVQKTIYDPCPVGYMMPDVNVWWGFVNADGSLNTTGVYDSGWHFVINDYGSDNVAWYPSNDSVRYWGDYSERSSETDYWYTSSTHSFHIDQYSVDYVWFDTSHASGFSALPIRCMKDEGHVDISFAEVEVVDVRDVTENSVKIVADVKREGAFEVTDRGIIWSASEDFSGAVKVSAGSGSGEFSCELTGLTSGTIYYVKAYAVNAKGESQSAVRVFSTRYSDSDAVDLSKYGTANCYIVSSPGLYVFNCMVKGNSNETVGSPASASVVWETKNTDAPVSTGDIVTSVELHGGYLSFEVPAPFTPGNALVAVKDASGNILWSWHIWVTDFDPDITVQTYISGAKMMDRNLGALDAGTTSTAYGFLYQWGRKDPLITSATGGSEFAVTAPADVRTHVSSVSGDMLEYTVKNPTHTVQNLRNPGGTWNSGKTMYDPCPSGWRVPDGGPEGVWSGIYWEGIEKDRGASTYWKITEQYSTPVAVYPAPGYTGGNTYELSFPGSALYCWSCTQVNEYDAYGMHLFDRIERELTSGKASEFSVRCQMMESDYSAEITYMVSESQSSVTVRGKVSIVRDCKIDEKGVVYSTTNQLPTIDNNDGKVKSDSTDAGEFECTINGIKRQTKYYIRPYVSGDKGVKYGKVMEYIERTPGSGEGFTGDDFVWE